MVDMGCITEDRELIDTLWNVNFVARLKRPSLLSELIDTLWNVNSEHFLFDFDLEQELIDTLWNVNQRKGAFFKATDSN